MTPVSWPFIPAEMASWVDHVNALDPSGAVFPEALAALIAVSNRSIRFSTATAGPGG